MLTLIVGGTGSGKSAYAEALVQASGIFPRYYLATMEPFGAEGQRRIARHREMRRDKGFTTLERYTHLSGLTLPRRGILLLEDVGNLAANERYRPDGAGEGALSAILEGIASLERQCDHLILVSDEVFTGGSRYLGDTVGYLRLLAACNRALASRAANVCEVICSIPQYYKGGPPFEADF